MKLAAHLGETAVAILWRRCSFRSEKYRILITKNIYFPILKKSSYILHGGIPPKEI